MPWVSDRESSEDDLARRSFHSRRPMTMRPSTADLSVGKALDVLAGILGWSPQGRRISVVSAEGPGRNRIDGRTFLVREVRDGNLVIADWDASAGSDLLLRPRHRGWTVRSLIGTPIVVTVHQLTAAGTGDAIGMAEVRLSKRS